MLDTLTNFGEINATTSGTTKSDVIVMIDTDEARGSISTVTGHDVNAAAGATFPSGGSIRAEKGPYDLRLVVYPMTVATQDITIELYEGNAVSGNNISTPTTVLTKAVSKDDIKVGVPVKMSLPLSYKKYWQLGVTTTGTVKVFAGLEFGA